MHASEQSRLARMTGPIGLGVLTLAGMLFLGTLGLREGDARWLGPLSAVVVFLGSFPFAVAYLLGAWGWGRPLAALIAPRSAQRHWIQLALGIGVALLVSHLLGVFGLLSAGVENEHAGRARIVGWGAVGAGLLVLIDQVARTTLRPEKWPVIPRSVMLLAPGAALLLIAACNAPGSLWRSEAGAYDALSYHLQLPKEWAAGTRLWPVEHNVYSYLPSYMEAAYLHLGTLMPGPADPLTRMIAGEGSWIIACQFLHALFALVAAALTGRAAAIVTERCGVTHQRAVFLGVLAGAMVLSLPWTIVTGSLAYNEAPMLVAIAGGLLAALDPSMRPWARGLAAGLCAGIAASCKPTAAFLGVPVIGIALLANMPVRAWVYAIVPGALAGCAAIAPWLIRNWEASGNPVFPFGAEQFGMGHWTLEQVARHGRSHRFVGTNFERVARLFSTEFGLRHDQWGFALVVIAASAIGVSLWKPARQPGLILLGAIGVEVLAWMFLTHLQSRFLLPVIVPMAVVFALLGAAMLARFSGGGLSSGGRSLAGVVLALVPLAFGAWAVAIFLADNSGHPNQVLVGGPAALTGFALEDRARVMPESEGEAFLENNSTPIGYVNTVIRPHESADAGVYLLGDGAPLYVLGASGLPSSTGSTFARQPRSARSPVFYHTTWDASPLGRAMFEHPGQPRAWTDQLRAMGIRYVLANYDELTRLIAADQNYDPSVTIPQIAHWTSDPGSGVVPVRAWPRVGAPPGAPSGYALFRLDGPEGRDGRGGAEGANGAGGAKPEYARP